MVIWVVFKGFDLEIEWTRVSDQNLMWIEAKMDFRNGCMEVEVSG